MTFPAGQTVQRLRRPRVTDQYNPGRQSLGSWSDAATVPIVGAYVALASTSPLPDPARSQVLTLKSLYCEPSVDVVVGDRIVSGGHIYEVDAIPEADTNPWTGWTPVLEVPLREVNG